MSLQGLGWVTFWWCSHCQLLYRSKPHYGCRLCGPVKFIPITVAVEAAEEVSP